MNARPALRLGLTGGIGSGKSTVAALLEQLGSFVIDLDALSRACTLSGGSAIPSIASTFGEDFLTAEGALDRQRMRDHVFAHSEARRTLEAIIHPLVGAEVRHLASASTARCLVFDIPLLVESPHWRHLLDRVVVVDCSHATQVSRVSRRNSWDAPTIEAVISSQSTRTQRLAAADIVLCNDTDQLEHLRQLVAQLAQQLGL